MPIRVKTGAGGAGNPYPGSWSAPIADGNLRFRWGGPWVNASTVKIKISDAVVGDANRGYGANPRWVDSGYIGYPYGPGNPYVYTWNYTQVQAAWPYAPSGAGAPISYYEVQLLHEDGSLWASENSTDNISPLWGIGQDTRARIRVRSVGAKFTSNWSTELRVQTGHDQTPNYGYVERTRYWESIHTSGVVNRDNWIATTMPPRVYSDAIHWRGMNIPGASPVTPAANRTVNWVLNSWGYGPRNNDVGTAYNNDNTDFSTQQVPGGGSWGYWGTNDENGNPTWWGVVPRGSGWSTTSNPYFMLHVDDLWLSGTEWYDNYEIVSWNPAVANSYW